MQSSRLNAKSFFIDHTAIHGTIRAQSAAALALLRPSTQRQRPMTAAAGIAKQSSTTCT